MADFNKAFSLTLEHEGGYANDKIDPGKETYKGVSRKFHPDWKGWKIVDDHKEKLAFPKSLDSDSLLQDHVKQFYKIYFWDIAKLDELYSQDIANEIFDTGVNQGIKTTVKYLQESLNILNRNEKDYKDISVDGILGNITLNLVNNHKRQFNILKCLNGLQFMKYYKLAKKNKDFEKYMNGWLNRVF